jgi:DNA-binding CsgD family transcriptional regulator
MSITAVEQRNQLATQLDRLLRSEIDSIIYSLDEVIGRPGITATARATLRNISRQQLEVSVRLREEILRLRGMDESDIAQVTTLRLIEPLTPREGEVLQLIANGMSAREISESLFLSEATIKSHPASLYLKFGTKSRVSTVSAARNAGLLNI